MIKVFVTGGTGYVGRHLIPVLIKKGYSVTALVRKGSDITNLKNKGVRLIYGDITKIDTLKDIENEDIDVVFHLACSLLPISDSRVNVKGAKNIIEIFRRKKIKRFIYTSSALVYGESYPEQIVDEEFSKKPLLKYAKQESEIEDFLTSLHKGDGFPVVILRFSEIFGGEGGFFEEYLRGIIKGKIPVIGNGRSNISMSYIGDVVSALLMAAERDDITGEVFNINIPEIITINDLVNIICEKAGVKKPAHVPVPVAWIVASMAMIVAKIIRKKPFLNYEIVRVATLKGGVRDISKAEKRLGFKPRFLSIKEGIEDCYFSSRKER